MTIFARTAFGAALLLAAQLASCELLRERPFEALSWSPGTRYPGHEALASAGIRFSSAADRGSVEAACSLTEDGERLRVRYVWDDDRSVRFVPYAGFSPNREYRLAVETGAHDESGVSLDRAFAETFFTRAAGERPRLLSADPADGTSVSDDRTPLRLSFSVPVEAAACRDHIDVSPKHTGSWSMEDGGRSAVFVPAGPWKRGSEYRIVVSSDMVDRLRIRSGIEYRSRFSVGSDREPPSLVRAEARDAANASVLVLAPDDGCHQTVNAGWEAAWRLALVFSEPVTLSSLDGALSVSGGPSLVRETTGSAAALAVYRFSERPAWDSLFALRLESSVEDVEGNAGGEEKRFRLRADGSGSRPPRLVGLRMPMIPSGADESAMELAAFASDDPFASLPLGSGADRYPIDAETPTVIELYLETAAGAAPSSFSLMDAFRVSATNGALSFSPNAVKLSGFRVPAPHGPWAEFPRVEVAGTLVNRSASGVVSFILAAGLIDSAGNAAGAEQALPLLK